MNEVSLGARLLALAVIIAIIALTATFPVVKEKVFGSKKTTKKE